MTRMFWTSGNALRALGMATTLTAFGLTGGCSSNDAPPPAAGNPTMDLSNATPPEPVSAPAAATPTAPPVVDTPPAPPAAPAQQKHTIAKGDTIYNLAAKYYGSGNKANQDKILAANPGLVATKMPVGKAIVIP